MFSSRVLSPSYPVPLSLRSVLRTREQYAWIWLFAATLAMSCVFLGCGNSGTAKAGPISVINPNAAGQLTALVVNSSAQLSMTPVSDSSNAGVNWTVLCGGSPLTGSASGGACGTFAPTHTPAGAYTIYTVPALVPLGTTVTLIGSLTGNPGASTSVTLPIITPPISVALLNPAASVGEGGSVGFNINLQNDTTNAGVTWSATCSLTPCGSFSPASGTQTSTTYTAPASVPQGGSVTITVTSNADSTQQAKTTLMVLPISVTVTPASAYVQALGTAQFKATVLNDGANAGVTWTTTCASANKCGSIGATGLFTAPAANSAGGVTIVATSKTDASQTGHALATISSSAPAIVSFTPAPPSTLAVGASQSITATVANDPGAAGLSWTVTCGSTGACGTINGQTTPVTTTDNATVSYVAPASIPAGTTVTITAALLNPASNSAVATITITAQPTIAFVTGPASTVTVNDKTTVKATVTNDAATGGGITWTVPCSLPAAGACGYVTPYQTPDNVAANYVAPPVPPGIPITVTATSASSAFAKIAMVSTPINVIASNTVTIRFVSLVSSQMQASSTISVNAAVGNDPTNGGVDYSVCGACGYFTIKPAVPATTTTLFVPPVTSNVVLSWPNGVPIPYTAPVEPTPVTIMANAHASGGPSTTAPITITTKNSGPSLTGSVFAGTQPVFGASVSLYIASASGYGAASILTYAPGAGPYVVTDANGAFTIQGGYGCPTSTSQVYLLAQGGQIGTNAPNPNLALMSALGACSNLNSNPLTINEVTTVVSSAALAPFAADDVLTGNKSYLNIGTSSTNAAGLANAFASVTNMVNLSTGQVLFFVPAGNAAVPNVKINTFADALNACTATGGGTTGDGSPCGALFANAAGLGSVSPQYVGPVSDTLQAAFNIAQHPNGSLGYGLGISELSAQVTPASPFQPILTKNPNDWSLALNFTGGGGLSSSSAANFLAVDASGNLWMSDSNNNSVIEWNTLGAPLSPATGYSASGLNVPGALAIDAPGNIWIVSKNGLSELNFLADPYPGSPFAGVTSGIDMAIDGPGNIWISNANSVSKFNSVGLQLSPSGAYINAGITAIGALAIDSSNNVWVGNAPQNSSIYDLAELSNAGGQLIVNGSLAPDVTFDHQLAPDGSGDIWTAVGMDANSFVCKMPPYGGIGTLQQATCYNLPPLIDPSGVAVDGSGNVWAADAGGSTGNGTFSANLLELVPADGGVASGYAYFVNPSSAAPLKVATDGSGNAWVLLADGTVTEYVGVATPAITPIALGANKGKLGAKP